MGQRLEKEYLPVLVVFFFFFFFGTNYGFLKDEMEPPDPPLPPPPLTPPTPPPQPHHTSHLLCLTATGHNSTTSASHVHPHYNNQPNHDSFPNTPPHSSEVDMLDSMGSKDKPNTFSFRDVVTGASRWFESASSLAAPLWSGMMRIPMFLLLS